MVREQNGNLKGEGCGGRGTLREDEVNRTSSFCGIVIGTRGIGCEIVKPSGSKRAFGFGEFWGLGF